ncbi:MAG: tandem-95 repeat protein [Propionibacteriaceae bacterium]|jgi:hypothetical protein|nr:tandem-95 repeat protein [Propionibacteriaceae bacterium]
MNWRGVASVGSVVALTCGLVGAAVASDGFPVAEIELNDTGVWVVNGSAGFVGRFNTDAGLLDGASFVDMDRFDVIQEDANVFVQDTDAGSVVSLNPSQLSLGRPVKLEAGATVTLGGGVVGVLMPSAGVFWRLAADALPAFQADMEVFPPTLEGLSSNTVAVTGVDGSSYVLNPSQSSLTTVRVTDAAAGVTESTVEELKGLDPNGTYSMTVVGSTPVVWSAMDRQLFLGSKSVVEVPETDKDPTVALQQPSAGATAVVYSVPSGLVVQPLNGSAASIQSVDSVGAVPTAPVQLSGCIYAVWGFSGDFVRDCVVEADDSVSKVEDVDPGDTLRLRVNRGRVVLNGVKSGGVWLVDGAIERKDNWDMFMFGGGGEVEEESKEDVDDSVQPDHGEVNHAPQAVDDSFGVRAGRSTLLPVVENDVDEDGDPLTVALDGEDPQGVTLGRVYDDSVFQIDVPAGESGPISFFYTASDGRGGESKARVSITVVPDEENSPPAAVRSTMLAVSTGKQVSKNVLVDWRDPDGDTLFLVKAVPESAEDVAQILPDGSFIFKDGGVSIGLKKVTIIVSDGRQEVSGEVMVSVLPGDNRKPQANNDLVSATVGQSVTVLPLLNDSDPDGDHLQLTSVSDDPRCALVKDFEAGKVTATCSEAGSVYLRYTVTDGPSPNQEGWIRINVTPPASQDTPPTAVPDTVLVASGQDAMVKVLDNDVNPLGFPLVVTGVSGTSGLPIDVAVVDYEKLKITHRQDFAAPVSFSYTVSNGRYFATSTVTVVQTEAPETILPPNAADDVVRVRAGDVATVHVLNNDTHPNGIPLRLLPDLVDAPDPDTQALVFTSGNTVRVHARQTPGVYRVAYQVVGTQGIAEPDTAQVTIYVTAPPTDQAGNQAPKPLDVEARTLAGKPVVIQIPLDGIDPDGDVVSLLGIGSAPMQGGQVTSVGPSTITYDPGKLVLGKVEFTYVVIDRLGQRAIGTIVVCVGPASDVNRPPVAVADAVETRPGKLIRTPVTANDSDPDGDTIAVVKAEAYDDAFPVAVEDNEIAFTAPVQEGDYWVTYVISDDLGLTASGVVSVHVAADVPPLKPVPQDDQAGYAEVLAQPQVVIEFLKNDTDPDGDVAEDVVDWDRAGFPGITVSGRVMTVPVADTLQIIDYWLTDPDGGIGRAFVIVPGVQEISPQLTFGVSPIMVKGGESVSFELSDYVSVRPDRTPRVVQKNTVTTWNGSITVDSVTRLTFGAPWTDVADKGSISVEVTDGESLEDESGLSAVVTIPVVILPSEQTNHPPTVRGSEISVEVGGEASLNMAPLASDPDAGDTLRFAIAAVPETNGVTASLAGPTLSVKASSSATQGTDRVVVSVTDGKSDSVSSQITIRIVASTRPLPMARDDEMTDAHQGQTYCIDVTSNDANPFPETELSVTAATLESGSGSVQIGCDGKENSVAVTPAGDFFGAMVVVYTIQDATHDASRQGQARIQLTVKGRPAAPAGLHIEQVGNQVVILSWSPSDNHGSPITSYTVSSVPVAGPWTCGTATLCQLTGLTNNVTYTFTVKATNAVGDSDPSLASAEARPDVIPNHPAPPTLDFGDQRLLVSWVNPGSEGSPVTSYNLRISPAPQSGQTEIIGVTGTSYLWTGLDNGTPYQIKVCAVNAAQGVCSEDSHWSTYSKPETPARPPDAPYQLSVARLSPIGDEARAEICWHAPLSDGGSAITSYTVKSSQDFTYAVTDGTTCRIVAVAYNETNVTFSVAARNKAGISNYSSASNPFRAFVPPGAVSDVTKVDSDNSCVLHFGPASLNGAKSMEVAYHWRANNKSSGSFGTATSGTATGLPNNWKYTIYVKAVTTVQGQSYEGPEVSVSDCEPYGLPITPVAGASKSSDANSSAVTLSWTMPPRNGRDVYLEVNVDNEGWVHQDESESTTRDSGWGGLHTISVRAVDVTGQVSAEASAQANGNTPPKSPAVQLRLGAPRTPTGRFLEVKLTDFNSNTVVSCRWSVTAANGGDRWFTIAVDGSGNHDWTRVLVGVVNDADSNRSYAWTSYPASSEVVMCRFDSSTEVWSP